MLSVMLANMFDFSLVSGRNANVESCLKWQKWQGKANRSNSLNSTYRASLLISECIGFIFGLKIEHVKCIENWEADEVSYCSEKWKKTAWKVITCLIWRNLLLLLESCFNCFIQNAWNKLINIHPKFQLYLDSASTDSFETSFWTSSSSEDEIDWVEVEFSSPLRWFCSSWSDSVPESSFSFLSSSLFDEAIDPRFDLSFSPRTGIVWFAFSTGFWQVSESDVFLRGSTADELKIGRSAGRCSWRTGGRGRCFL